MWVYQRPRPIQTARSGTLWLSRLFGVWRLRGADGSEQASPYMDGLWRDVLRRIAKGGTTRSRVLVLGVALGGTFALVRRRWPAATIVGVDWEPSLFDLGRELGVHRVPLDDPATRVVGGDAAAVVPTLDGAFDLVLVDLFIRSAVARAASEPALIDGVARRLAPGAVVAVNAFMQPRVLARWRMQLGPAATFQHRCNLVALFSR